MPNHSPGIATRSIGWSISSSPTPSKSLRTPSNSLRTPSRIVPYPLQLTPPPPTGSFRTPSRITADPLPHHCRRGGRYKTRGGRHCRPGGMPQNEGGTLLPTGGDATKRGGDAAADRGDAAADRGDAAADRGDATADRGSSSAASRLGPRYPASLFSVPQGRSEKKLSGRPQAPSSKVAVDFFPKKAASQSPTRRGPTRDLFSAGRKGRWKKRRLEGGPAP